MAAADAKRREGKSVSVHSGSVLYQPLFNWVAAKEARRAF